MGPERIWWVGYSANDQHAPADKSLDGCSSRCWSANCKAQSDAFLVCSSAGASWFWIMMQWQKSSRRKMWLWHWDKNFLDFHSWHQKGLKSFHIWIKQFQDTVPWRFKLPWLHESCSKGMRWKDSNSNNMRKRRSSGRRTVSASL